jgi:protein TonB
MRRMLLAALMTALLSTSIAEPTPVLRAEASYDTPPRVLHQPRPHYPIDAMDAEVEGKVALKFVVSSKGDVSDVHVIESIPMLDEAAVANVREWKFEAARKEGQPVSALVHGVVTFRFAGGAPNLGLFTSAYIGTGKTNKKAPELIGRLAAGTPDARADAAWQLSGLRAADPAVILALMAALHDPVRIVRQRAALALFVLEPPTAPSALPRATESEWPPTQRPLPGCPDKAARRKVDGVVELDLLVSELGKVLHANVLSPKSLFDETAVIAASHWRYAPRKEGGSSVIFKTHASMAFECRAPVPKAVGDAH